MRARKTDANLTDLVDDARRCGFLVHVTNGEWDLTVQLAGVTDPQQAMMSAVAQFAEMFGEEALRRGFAVQRPGDVEVEPVSVFELAAWPFDISDWSEAIVFYRRRVKLTTELQARYPGLDWSAAKGQIDQMRSDIRGIAALRKK